MSKGEDAEQRMVIEWSRWHEQEYPELKWLFHCPNGGFRNAWEAAKFKKLGVKAGVSDLQLPAPKGIYHGLFIEMKYGNNKLQDTQKEFLADMSAAGYFVVTCYTGDLAIEVLEKYLGLGEGEEMEIENNISLKVS